MTRYPIHLVGLDQLNDAIHERTLEIRPECTLVISQESWGEASKDQRTIFVNLCNLSAIQYNVSGIPGGGLAWEGDDQPSA